MVKPAWVTSPSRWLIDLYPVPFAQGPIAAGLDFSDPASSGFLAALIAGSNARNPGSALDFSIPANSGLIASLVAGSGVPEAGPRLDFTDPINSGLVAALAA